ncbi:MAG: 3-phenylpropionate/cinnamic acid dioxygenase subunit beta [Rhodococcus sp. (in: high G+C Gram-positive bacteria)]
MTATAIHSPSTKLVGTELQHEIEQFLYDEADLMDSWKVDEWYTLMAPDIHYWAPTQQNRTVRERGQEIAAPMTAAYFDEDHALIGQRVRRMNTNMAWAEEPRSRIRHLICNVRVRPTGNPDEFEVDSSFYVFRTRMEKEMDHFVGRRYDLIRRDDNPHGFQIARRTILLDMSTLLAKNISLFF